MGESKIRDIRSVEGRAAIRAAEQRRSRIKDRFGRGLEVGDGVLIAGANPYEIVWRIEQVTPAVGPDVPPNAVFVDVVAQTRVLFMPGMDSPNVTLVLTNAPPKDDQEKQDENPGGIADQNTPPGAARTASGLYIPPDDGASDR